MNKELIKVEVQEIIDNNYAKFMGTNEAEIHSVFEIAELFEKHFLEKDKEIMDLKSQLSAYQLRSRANYGLYD